MKRRGFLKFLGIAPAAAAVASGAEATSRVAKSLSYKEMPAFDKIETRDDGWDCSASYDVFVEHQRIFDADGDLV